MNWLCIRFRCNLVVYWASSGRCNIFLIGSTKCMLIMSNISFRQCNGYVRSTGATYNWQQRYWDVCQNTTTWSIFHDKIIRFTKHQNVYPFQLLSIPCCVRCIAQCTYVCVFVHLLVDFVSAFVTLQFIHRCIKRTKLIFLSRILTTRVVYWTMERPLNVRTHLGESFLMYM